MSKVVSSTEEKETGLVINTVFLGLREVNSNVPHARAVLEITPKLQVKIPVHSWGWKGIKHESCLALLL